MWWVIINYRAWAKEWSLGCVNPVFWLSLAAGREFTQPRDHSFAQPCTCPIFILLDDWWKICIVGLKLQTVQFIHVIIFFVIYSNCTALARLIWALSVISHHSGGGLFRLARFRPPASHLTPDTIFTGDFHEKRTQLTPGYYGRYGALGGFYIRRLYWRGWKDVTFPGKFS